MNRILEMREKRGQIWDRAKAVLKEHEDEICYLRCFRFY